MTERNDGTVGTLADKAGNPRRSDAATLPEPLLA
jgi:hypothetical protein